MEVGAPRETDKVESLRYAPFFFVRANPAKGLILLQKYLPGADLDHKRKELTFQNQLKRDQSACDTIRKINIYLTAKANKLSTY
jgi:hypothetical protein